MNLGSVRFSLPFFRTPCGVGILNSAIFNSFHNRVEFGKILEGLRNFGGGMVEHPKPPPRYATGYFLGVYSKQVAECVCCVWAMSHALFEYVLMCSIWWCHCWIYFVYWWSYMTNYLHSSPQISVNTIQQVACSTLSDTYLTSGPPISTLGHTPSRVQQIQLRRWTEH